MENVVRLAAWRKRRKGPSGTGPAAAPPEMPRYFCTRCDADEFRLAENGTVHCGHCGALMRNLAVNPRT